MANRINTKEKLVEKALESLQLIQDTNKQAKDRQISPYDYPEFQDAWDQSSIHTDSLRKYLDKTGEKLVYAGDDPWDPETIKMQDLSLQLGRTYVQSNAKTDFTAAGFKEDIRTGSPYSEQGTWLSIGGAPKVDWSGLSRTVNLSGDESFEGWRDKSTPLMDLIKVKGRR